MNNYRRVVVTGLGVVSPVGSDVETAWTNLTAGFNGIGPITYFDTTNYKAKLAAQVRDFDPLVYMDRSEMLRSDKFTQYALGAAAQAVSESGVIGTLPPERVAVYFGSGIGGLNTVSAEIAKLNDRGPHRVSPLCVPMMIANMAAGQIAIRYNCQGPALPAVTACASGSNAIGEALRLIRHGYADAVITGGAESSIVPVGVAGFINMKALSTASDPDAASLPFDARRSGFVIGEGAAVLVLEEYGHALARGAKIYGELCGYGSTCDAHHITAPHPEAEGGARAMTQALQEAGYTGSENVYVNAHGTGTPLNDSGETLAIKKALGQEQAYRALVSSTKSMTGHMLGAAGAMEAVVCLKVLETGVVPPTINLHENDTVKPLYTSENVCSFFGYTREQWLDLARKPQSIREFISQSGMAYADVQRLFAAGEAEFSYFDMGRSAYRRIRAICSRKVTDGIEKIYVMLYNLEPKQEEQPRRQVSIRTFGYFDVFVDGKPIAFRNEKSKELFALLVDRRGGFVPSEEAIGFLWENEPADPPSPLPGTERLSCG